MNDVKHKPRHLFLTGPPGVGKSTLLKDVLKVLGKSISRAGFYTEEIRSNDGKRTGFLTIDAANTSRTEMLASAEERGEEEDKKMFVGRYRVYADSAADFVDTCFADVEPSIITKPRLMVLDEVGAMYVNSYEWVYEIFNSNFCFYKTFHH
jgi:nucleoside-triphosphatase